MWSANQLANLFVRRTPRFNILTSLWTSSLSIMVIREMWTSEQLRTIGDLQPVSMCEVEGARCDVQLD